MTKLLKAMAAIGMLAMANMVLADTVTYTGNTETSADGSWMRPNADFTMLDVETVLYSVTTFTVSADGMYDISSIQGFDSNGDQYDGFIFVYASAFDPLNALSGGIAADDDGPNGVGTSEIIGVGLSAGLTYYMVTSAFDPALTQFGSGAGPFTNTISGPGDITLGTVPVPAAIWLMLSGLIGLRVMRRK